MVPRPTTIHIFSVIPKLADIVAKKLPDAIIKNVISADVSKKYEMKVTEEEFLQIKNAEVILGDAQLIAQVYDKLLLTKWIQFTWAGVEKVIEHVQKGSKPTFPVTRMGTQGFSQLMAEFTIGWILNYERDWLGARHYQMQHVWAHKDKIAIYRSFQELTVAVLGVGLIGSEVVQALKHFKCRVLGLGRSKTAPAGLSLDQYFSTSELPSLLEKCDYIVNILPSTSETKGLLGNDVLRFARKCPVFMNIGRGDIIQEEDIIGALEKRWISAAILDVFEVEPLPQSSRLWSHPRVILTPHVAGVSRDIDVVTAFLDNLEKFSKGEPLKNLIDWDRGY